jgi:hypothetical protein
VLNKWLGCEPPDVAPAPRRPGHWAAKREETGGGLGAGGGVALSARQYVLPPSRASSGERLKMLNARSANQRMRPDWISMAALRRRSYSLLVPEASQSPGASLLRHPGFAEASEESGLV